MKVFLFFLVLAVAAAIVCHATLSQSDKKTKKNQKRDAEKPGLESGSSDASVYMKNLVTTKISSKEDILNHYSNYHNNIHFRNFDSTVLGYVTPWNNHGYDVAKIFGGTKISLVSPVWLQVFPVGEVNYKVEGLQDKDVKWMSQLKKQGAKVVPRLLFDKWTGKDFMNLFQDPNRVNTLTKLLLMLCMDNDFDGLVLEVWSQLGGQAKTELSKLIIEISKGLKKAKRIVVVVIPPPVYHNDVEGMIDLDAFDRMANNVDYFSLMTYDYSSAQRPGPNSPVDWVRKCVEHLDPQSYHRSQILLGLNFYGYDYTSEGGGPMVNQHHFCLHIFVHFVISILCLSR
jgi:chitinase domain-containing protein 1